MVVQRDMWIVENQKNRITALEKEVTKLTDIQWIYIKLYEILSRPEIKNGSPFSHKEIMLNMEFIQGLKFERDQIVIPSWKMEIENYAGIQKELEGISTDNLDSNLCFSLSRTLMDGDYSTLTEDHSRLCKLLLALSTKHEIETKFELKKTLEEFEEYSKTVVLDFKSKK